MFRVTALGNHGWLIETATSRLLVDPVLSDEGLRVAGTGLVFYPPRRFSLAALGPVDAVFLTHDHDGHFEPASLLLLDRRIPVLRSAASSEASARLLAELGFTVQDLRPDEEVAVGEDLVLVPLGPGELARETCEWDTLAWIARDRGGHGSFFSTVDHPAGPTFIDSARRHLAQPGIWAITSNEMEVTNHLAWALPDRHRALAFARGAATHHKDLCERWTAPAAVVLVEVGYAFDDDHDWMNAACFPVPMERIAPTLATMCEQEALWWLRPGASLTMCGGVVDAYQEDAPWLACLPRASWPARSGGEACWVEITPMCGRTRLAEGEVVTLNTELQRFAAHLYGRRPFRRLCSLDNSRLDGRAPTFALVLRDGDEGEAWVYAYDLRGCRFVPVSSADPPAEYALVYECWATDLLGVLRGRLPPTALYIGHCHEWAIDVELFDLTAVLAGYSHPLRMPEQFLARWRELLAGLPAVEPVVRARARP